MSHIILSYGKEQTLEKVPQLCILYWYMIGCCNYILLSSHHDGCLAWKIERGDSGVVSKLCKMFYFCPFVYFRKFMSYVTWRSVDVVFWKFKHEKRNFVIVYEQKWYFTLPFIFSLQTRQRKSNNFLYLLFLPYFQTFNKMQCWIMMAS